MRSILPPLARLALCCCAACARPESYTVVRRLPHDTHAYTQGLVWDRGRVYESTGRYGHSQLRRLDPATGSVEASRSLPPDRFGEGLAMLRGRLYQLTWESKRGYVYDPETLALVDSFAYAGEGWGLASDGELLIMSNGTATLRFLDPATWRVMRELTVNDHGSPLQKINELEYVRGELFANIYQTDWIVRIDATSGEVREWIDMATLFPRARRGPSTDVLNGIAFNEQQGTFLVTGKLWPQMFEVRLREMTGLR